MNLYELSMTDEGDEYFTYDCYDGFVVRAETPKKARELVGSGADEARGSGAPDFWQNPKYSTIKILASDVKGEPGIILASFNAG